MSYPIKNIAIDRPVMAKDGKTVVILRSIFKLKQIVDYPFIVGSVGEFFTNDFINKYSDISTGGIIDEPFVNASGLFKQIINIGQNGWYFVALPEGMIFRDLAVSPSDVDIDLYFHDNQALSKAQKKATDAERGLLFSFYNSTTERINVTAKLVADIDGVYGKIRANLDDIQLRNYYLKQCLMANSKYTPQQKQFPDIMSTREAADYLGIAKHTLDNWVSEGKIEVTKVGRLNKFKKANLDKFLERHTGTSHQIRKSQKSKKN